MASQPLPATTTLEQQLFTLISERLLETEPGFNADSNLYDAGLDSMAIMQLLVLVEEEYGIALPESDLTRHNFSTIHCLAELIRDRISPSR